MDTEYILFWVCCGIVLIAYIAKSIVDKIAKDIRNEKINILNIKKELDKQRADQIQREHELQRQITYVNKKEQEIRRIINEKAQEFPYLASVLSEWEYLHETMIADMLKNKKPPALKASEEIRRINKEKRVIEKKYRVFEHQIKMYEALFPWLEEFKELPPEEAYRYISLQEEQDEYSRVKEWLSPEEYSKLSDAEKWQLALERYIGKSNKTNWHIGVEYERYIGYLYESKGYKVHYEGALMGVEDKGRDLIVEREKDCLVIQCKRWAKEKEIHEKHIMQLFGSVAELNLRNSRIYKGVFITTASLSEMARHFAQLLNIEVVENYSYNSYPMVKCNVSQNGEKIYHLPFDQQYDRIHMDMSKGNLYVHNVFEAEQNGFRHAHRWMGVDNA